MIKLVEHKLIKEETDRQKLYNKLYEILGDLEQYINKNFNGFWEIYNYDVINDRAGKIVFEIDGDWKHDHLRFNYIVEKYFDDNNIQYIWYGEDVLEDTGSDWYPAIHTWKIFFRC